MNPKKVLSVDDSLYLYQDENPAIKYTVSNIYLGLGEDGHWNWFIDVTTSTGIIEPHSTTIIEEMMRDGQIWTDKLAKTAEMIRKRRKNESNQHQ